MANTKILIHANDLALCHGANLAYRELATVGFVDSGSIIVPCPWFKGITEMAAADTNLDLGVHLTLNADKDHYKWRPLTRPSPTAGLTDGDGFMWATVAELRANCEPEAAEAEMRAQIDVALEFGIDVTHVDAHMFAALAPEFCEAYLRIGVDYRLPVMLPTHFDGARTPRQLVGADEAPYRAVLERARSLGFPILDQFIEANWQRTDSAWDICQGMFERAAGLTLMALHPAIPGEIEFIEPATARIRTGEYEFFSDPEFQGWVDTLNIPRTTWRRLRDDLRAHLD